MCSIDVPELADLDGLEPRALASLLAETDGARRRLEAMIAEMVGVADRTAAYAEDGHASVSGWAKATCNWSSGETKAMVQTARLLHAIPEARSAAHAGVLGVAQAHLLAKVFANPRWPNSCRLRPNCWSVTPTACGSTSSLLWSVVGKHSLMPTAPMQPMSVRIVAVMPMSASPGNGSISTLAVVFLRGW